MTTHRRPSPAIARAQDIIARIKVVAEWRKRIKAGGLTVADFCAAHGLDATNLSRWISKTRLPRWKAIKRVEQKLKKAGL